MPTATFRIWRGNREQAEFRDYPTEVSEGMVVLDAVHRVQAEQAQDLAVRWNCKAGKCGSCSAEIDGQPRLMCMTRMDLFRPGEPISVAPIRTFPIIRDLVRHKPAFAGPRLFIKIAALDMHPLDTGDRTEFVRRQAGIGLCNITKC